MIFLQTKTQFSVQLQILSNFTYGHISTWGRKKIIHALPLRSGWKLIKTAGKASVPKTSEAHRTVVRGRMIDMKEGFFPWG